MKKIPLKKALEYPIPANTSDFIDRMEDEIESYQEEMGEQTSPNFEMADYREVASTLLWMQANQAIPGHRFVEWGAGFGVVAGIAARLGLAAYGAEQDPLLHAMALRLHKDEELETTLLLDNFHDPQDERLTTARFDLVYAYPWPREVAATTERFEATARYGSRLLLFLTFGELELWEKD